MARAAKPVMSYEATRRKLLRRLAGVWALALALVVFTLTGEGVRFLIVGLAVGVLATLRSSPCSRF
jgi:hypothetical protein